MRIAPGIALAAAVSLSISSVAVAAPDAAIASAPEAPTPETPTPEAPTPETEAPVVEAPSIEETMFAARVAEAEKHYIEAKARMSEERYAEAAAEFERSHASIEFGDTLYKIIDAYEAANEPLKALKRARAYLALPACDGGRESPANYPCAEPEQRDDTRVRADRLRRLVGELKLQLGEGVVLREVRVAGRTVPLAEFPVLVPPGSFVVEMAGPKKDQLRSYNVTVEAGETFNVFVAPFRGDPVVTDRDPARVDDDPPLDDPRRRRILKGAFWTGVGLTALSGVATAVLGALTLRAGRQYKRDKCSPECTAEMYEALPNNPALPDGMKYPLSYQDAVARFKPATNTMIGVTAGLGIVTVVLGIFAYTRKPSRANARLQVRAGGLSLRW